MHPHHDLIRYHLESVVELADENSLPILKYLAEMAIRENAGPKNDSSSTMVRNEPNERLVKLAQMLKVG